MIKINDISTKLKFPVIDFKFQNSGDATAFIWQFIIDIKKLELNIIPSLSFEYKVVSTTGERDFFRESSIGNLEIIATNNGYGTALNCNVEICHPDLEKLFSKSERTFIGQIQSGESKSIITLAGDKLSTFADKFEINEITAMTSCNDLKGVSHSYTNYVSNDYGHWNKLSVTNKGFLFEYGFYQLSVRGPSEIYCVILDPDKGAHKRTYKISREIKSGDIDRFHIMIGCSKSAQIDMNFQFAVDRDTFINSDLFQINIWNPMNSRTYDNYTDGDVLKQAIEKMTHQKKESNDNWELDSLKWKLRGLEQEENFPFYNPNKKSGYDW